MQYRKCVALFAAMLVGFGVVAVDAATVNSVTIVSPADSGALRGIDSTFTVRAKILDFTPNDSLEVIFYLVTSNDSTVVADSLNLHANSGIAIASIIGKAIKQTAGVGQKVRTTDGRALNSSSSLGDAVVGQTRIKDEGALIAVRATRGVAMKTSAIAATGRTARGDGDSIRATTSGDTTTFTWYGKVHYSSDTVTGVRAAAIAIDGTGTTAATLTDTTQPKLSPGNLLITIDADRPANPASMVYSASASAAGNRTGTPNLTVSGIPNNASNDKVLGISDTL
jgi:hypothetical protein